MSTKKDPAKAHSTRETKFTPHKRDGTVVWENKESENDYHSMKNKLNTVVKSAHQILYNNGSIVGNKAVTDIQKLLALKLLEREFNNPDSVAGKSLVDLESKTKSIGKFSDYVNVCKNLSILKDQDNPLTFWENMVSRVLMKTYPYVFNDEDKKFHITSETGFQELVSCVGSLKITDEFLDAFATTCGDVHESFLAYSGGKAAKDLGQFFTPRKLINLIFKGNGTSLEQYISEIDDPSIYDPCMGTGGFLTRTFKHCNILSENVYGCETEQDTIKFAFTSCLMTMGDTQANLIKCNSLSQNKLVFERKMSSIVTNPPFGTKMNYVKLEKEFNDFKDKNSIESTTTFKDIYPLKTNNGAALFVMHCVFMLEENGVCAVVLPDGELFEGSSKWSMNFREWLCDNVNIRTIVKAPSGTFDHAGVKTNIVIFTKTGATKDIEFFETDKDCQKLKKIFNVSESDLAHKKYSLDIGEYSEEESENYDVPMVPLCEVITKLNDFEKVNANKDYKLVKMSKSKDPEIREVKIGNLIKSPNLQKIRENTIIISKILNYCFGLYNENIKDGYLSSEFWIFENKENVLFDYIVHLYYYNIIDRLKSISHGVGVPRINFNDFMNKIKIPLPSLEVQQQIVDELSQIETSIQTIETRISELKNEKDMYKKYARKGEIKELLKGSEEKILKDLYNINYGNKNSTNTEEEAIYPSISGGSKVSKYTNKWNILENTILIARSGSCGSVNMFNTKCLMGSYGFFLEKINDKVNTKFNYHYLKEYQSSIESLARGTAVKNLNRDKLYNFKIPLPSPEIQQQCIQIFEEKEKFIQTIDEKITQEQKYIDDLKLLAKDVITSFC